LNQKKRQIDSHVFGFFGKPYPAREKPYHKNTAFRCKKYILLCIYPERRYIYNAAPDLVGGIIQIVTIHIVRVFIDLIPIFRRTRDQNTFDGPQRQERGLRL
jgi:hypothetical protein